MSIVSYRDWSRFAHLKNKVAWSALLLIGIVGFFYFVILSNHSKSSDGTNADITDQTKEVDEVEEEQEPTSETKFRNFLMEEDTETNYSFIISSWEKSTGITSLKNETKEGTEQIRKQALRYFYQPKMTNNKRDNL